MISRRQQGIQTDSIAANSFDEVYLQNNSLEVRHKMFIKREFTQVDSTNEKNQKSESADTTFRPVKSAYMQLPGYDGSSLLNFVQMQSKSLAALVSGITQESGSKNNNSMKHLIHKSAKLRRKTSGCQKINKALTSPSFYIQNDDAQKSCKSVDSGEIGSMKPALTKSGCNLGTADPFDFKKDEKRKYHKSINSGQVDCVKPSLSGCNLGTVDLLDIKNDEKLKCCKTSGCQTIIKAITLPSYYIKNDDEQKSCKSVDSGEIGSMKPALTKSGCNLGTADPLDFIKDEKIKYRKSNNSGQVNCVKPSLSGCELGTADLLDTKNDEKQKRCKTSGCQTIIEAINLPSFYIKNDDEQKSCKSVDSGEIGSMKPALTKSGCHLSTADPLDFKKDGKRKCCKSYKSGEVGCMKPVLKGYNLVSVDLPVINCSKPDFSCDLYTANLLVNDCSKPDFSRNLCTADLPMSDCSEPDFSCNLCAADLPVDNYSKANYIQTGDPESRTSVSTEENFFRCSHCPVTFSKETDLNSHVKIHSIHSMNKPFRCSICSASFCKQMALKKHLLMHDRKSFKCHASSQPKKKFNCTLCPANFSRKFDLNRHVLVHSRRDLHNSTQSVDKQCFFERCSADMNQESNLSREMHVQGDVESFTCNFCPASFTSKGLLEFHVRNKHTFTHPSALISGVQLDINSDRVAESESEKTYEPALFNRNVMARTYKVRSKEEAQLNKASFENLSELGSQPIKIENELHEECDLLAQLQENSGAALVSEIKEEVQDKNFILKYNGSQERYDLSEQLQANSGADLISEIKEEKQDKSYFLSENVLHGEYDLSEEPHVNSGADLDFEIKEELLDKSNFLHENELHEEYNLSEKPQANSGADLVSEIKEEIKDQNETLIHNLHGSTVIDFDTPSLSCTIAKVSERGNSLNGFGNRAESQADNFCVFSEGKILSFSSSSFEIRKINSADTPDSSQSKILANPQGHHIADQIKLRKVSVVLTDLFPSHFRKLGKAHTNDGSCVCIYCTGGRGNSVSPESQLKNIEKFQGIDLQSTVSRTGKLSQGEISKLLPLKKSLPDDKQGSGPNTFPREPNDEKSFKCNICAKEFKCFCFLRMHNKVMHKDTKFSYGRFTASFPQETKLNQSLLATEHGNGSNAYCGEPNNENPFKCNICAKACNCQNSQIMHDTVMHECKQLSYSHFTESFPQNTKPVFHCERRSYCCEHCSQSFERKTDLRKHMTTHNRQILHRCHLCPALFKRKHNLKTHLLRTTHVLIHSRENPKQRWDKHACKPWIPRSLSCNVCAGVFTNKSSLNTHMLVHLFDKSPKQTSVLQ